MIRNFLYLDSQKLRSVSSQLFEGVTDYVLHNEVERIEETEQQKGPVASGKLLGDIFAKEQSSSEMRFLEDYAYSIFEDRIKQLEIVEDSIAPTFTGSSKKSFFKITNNITINDVGATNRILERFNEIGEAIARVSMMQHGANKSGRQISDSEIKRVAAEQNLQMDAKLLKSLHSIISFGLSDVLEVSLIANGHLFTAPLKRESLRETAEMIRYKYSRVTQQEFSLVGMVTQRGAVEEANNHIPNVKDAEGFKVALRTLSLHMRTVEQTFAGPLSSEIVLDPIAVYYTI